MTGDRDKIGTVRPLKLRITRRQRGSRRKMSRTVQQLDSKSSKMRSEVTLAVSENLLPTKQQDFRRILECQIPKSTEIITTETKVGSEEPKLAKEDCQETRHLKELLLLHLDLIQQQQELLAAKDKQIAKASKENEGLRCRLDRMERRMALLRQKGSKQQPIHSSEMAKDTAIAPSSANRVTAEATEPRGHKRRHALEPTSLSKRFAAASRHDSDKSQSPAKHRSVGASSQKKLPTTRDSRTVVLPQPDDIPKRPCDQYFMNSEAAKITDIKRKLNKIAQKSSRRHKNNKLLRTSIMYYVPMTTEPDVPVDISPKKADPSEQKVQVPTWRIRHIPRAYTLEGTENLGDDIYLKRHQKPETDEKRRKRWDMQRMREQKIYDKLNQSRGADGAVPSAAASISSNSTEDDEPVTFHPKLSDIESIEVCDDIPVTVFGQPIPELSKKEFALPWFKPEKRERGERSRSSRSRKR